MDYKVVITEDAEADLEGFLLYQLYVKGSVQSAKKLLDDFDMTRLTLARMAKFLNYCQNPKLRKLGYRRINLVVHKYFILYRIEGETVIVDGLFHEKRN